MSDAQPKSQLLTGAIIGCIFTAIGSIAVAWAQFYFSRQQQETQLFLDEKKDFVGACDEYLNQYREWYELMNYYSLKDSIPQDYISEFDSTTARNGYLKWKKNFDLAYGKIFLHSNNDFVMTTMVSSTTLHTSLATVITSRELTSTQKHALFQEANEEFIETWMVRAQQEIFQYNSGERIQKTIHQTVAEMKDKAVEQSQDDSAVNKMYEGLRLAQRFKRREDSLAGKPYQRWQMPDRKEFREFVRPEGY